MPAWAAHLEKMYNTNPPLSSGADYLVVYQFEVTIADLVLFILH